MSFTAEALARLRWMESELRHAEGTDRQALESARAELLELIWLACELFPNRVQ